MKKFVAIRPISFIASKNIAKLTLFVPQAPSRLAVASTRTSATRNRNGGYQMHSNLLGSALFACLCSLLILSAGAELTPIDPVTPTPPPAPTVPPVSPSPIPTAVPVQTPSIPQSISRPTPPAVNPEESSPVLISYGQDLETRVQVHHGLMEPVGVPIEQSVTVTLFLPSAYAGQIVKLGLYDGGKVGPPTLPGQQTITFTAPLPVSADGMVQFNFQAGRTFGLYRVLVTAGPAQFLLQFYAVRPRADSGALPVPTPYPTSPPPDN
jgi:hypothetical protein